MGRKMSRREWSELWERIQVWKRADALIRLERKQQGRRK